MPQSPNLSRALQNQNLRTASYILPDGTIIDPRQQVTTTHVSLIESSIALIVFFFFCHISSQLYFSCCALLCLIQQPISPNLVKALNNPALREASYALPDGTIVIDPKKPKSPNLSAALQNPYLKSASYTLPDGTIIIDPRKPVSPTLANALQNSALRDASFTLPEGVHDPNIPMSPNLAKVSC